MSRLNEGQAYNMEAEPIGRYDSFESVSTPKLTTTTPVPTTTTTTPVPTTNPGTGIEVWEEKPQTQVNNFTDKYGDVHYPYALPVEAPPDSTQGPTPSPEAPPPTALPGTTETQTPPQPPPNQSQDRLNVQDLYPTPPEGGTMDVPTVENPTGANVTEANLDEGNVATPTDATTQTGAIVAGAIDDIVAGTSTAEQTGLTAEQQVDAELARILGQDSPLLASARQEAMRQMNARGLTNTSMAAGATYGAMVDAALPMAQQNAEQAFQRELDNTRNRQEMSTLNVEQIAELRALEAELGQELSITNADQLAQAQRLTAELRSAMEQGNMEAYNRAAEQLADLERDAQKQQADLEGVAAEREFLERQAYEEITLEAISELNRQYMVGEQNLDVQDLIASYAQIRSANETAANMTSSYIDAIAAIYDNPEMSDAQANKAIQSITTMYQGTMEMLSGINGMDFGSSGNENTSSPIDYPDGNFDRPPKDDNDYYYFGDQDYVEE